jgi:hypothetical protein
VKPEVVIACYGINDGIYLPLEDARFAAFKDGVARLIEQCHAAGVKDVILVTPPIYDFNAKPGEFNYDSVMTAYAAWEMAIKKPGVRVIDLHTAMRKAREARDKPFSGDRIHPGDEGHLLMARTILAGAGIPTPDVTVADIRADPLFPLVDKLRSHRASTWMQHIGYTREKTVKPGPLGEAEAEAGKIREKIDALRRVRAP